MAPSDNRKKPSRYDPWYAKVAFGLFLFVLVGSLAALYSGLVQHLAVVK
jgi:hypothetical protein